MIIKNVLFMLFTITACFAKDFAYININSNIKNTKIQLNGEDIGTTPIFNYKIIANKPYSFNAISNNIYYQNNISKIIQLEKDQLKECNFKFKKENAKILLLGEPVDLYINDKFIKQLKDSNRLITVKASPTLRIKLINTNEDTLTILKDIHANTKTNIKYKLVKTNDEIKLYTTFIDNDIWEDKKENASKVLDWYKATTYCKLLELGGFTDWQLPTIEQLNNLYLNKNKIYNGFSKGYYWSRSMKKSDNNLWQYAYIKYFETSEIKYSVKETARGSVRCVRSIQTKEFE